MFKQILSYLKSESSYFLSPRRDKTPFQKGDKVTAFGNIGTVKGISPNGLFLEVTFPDTLSTVIFHLDGKLMQWHKVPSLRKL